MEHSDSMKRSRNSVDEKTSLLCSIHSSENIIPEPVVKKGEGESSKPGFSFRNLTRTEKWTFLSLAFVNFCAFVCFSLLAPFFPHEAEKKGVSKTLIGFIFSTFELVIFLSSPIFGSLIVKIGPKFMFISGVCMCGVCAILFGLLDQCPSGTLFIVMCFVCRGVEALGCSAFITSSFAIIANAFPDNVGTVFGTLETFSGMGLMVGPPIGGALYELGGFGLPFWVLGTTLLVCAAISCYIMPGHTEGMKSYQGSILTLLKSPLVCLAVFCIFCGSFALGFMDPTLADHLSPFKLSTFLVGLVFLCGAGMYGFTAPIWGWLSDTKGLIKGPMVVGNLLACVAYILMGPSPLFPFLPYELWLIILSLVIMGIFLGCALISAMKCILLGAKQLGFEDSMNTFGLVSGCFNSAFSLGTFTGPTIGGLMTQYYGFKWSATLAAGLLLLAAIFMALYSAITSSCTTCKKVFVSCLDESFREQYDSIEGKNEPTAKDSTSVVHEEPC